MKTTNIPAVYKAKDVTYQIHHGKFGYFGTKFGKRVTGNHGSKALVEKEINTL